MRPQDIRIKVVNVPDDEDRSEGDCTIRHRNICTIQAALLRGDSEITLMNWDFIPDDVWREIRRSQKEPNKVEVTKFVGFGPTNKDRDGYLAKDAQEAIGARRWLGLHFKFIKVLAAGGHGYVTLWDITFDDGSCRRVVIKRALSHSFNPQTESTFHLRYNGSEHTTQVVNLHAEAMKIQQKMSDQDPLAFAQFRAGHQWNAERVNCVVFEYCPYGDLYHLMTSAAERNVEFTNRVLWGIWECLVQGIATMAYSQEFIKEGTSFEKELWKAKKENSAWEFFDGLEEKPISHEVHLDMESLNILVGENETHPDQPIFKIHDLGAFSWVMNDVWQRMREKNYWNMRMPVKLHGLTPEQVSKEWDQLSIGNSQNDTMRLFANDNLRFGCVVAGRFGTWTNIFLIGRVMESVITGVFQRFPFQNAPHQTKDGSSAAQTHGWMLNQPEYSLVDAELREIVCQCLYERPQDRPSAVELLRNIEVRKSLGFSETKAEVKNWWDNFVGPREEVPLPARDPGANFGPVQQAVADNLGPLAMQPLRPPHQPQTEAEQQLAAALDMWKAAQADPDIGGVNSASRSPNLPDTRPVGEGNQGEAGPSRYVIPQRRDSEEEDRPDINPQGRYQVPQRRTGMAPEVLRVPQRIAGDRAPTLLQPAAPRDHSPGNGLLLPQRPAGPIQAQHGVPERGSGIGGRFSRVWPERGPNQADRGNLQRPFGAPDRFVLSGSTQYDQSGDPMDIDDEDNPYRPMQLSPDVGSPIFPPTHAPPSHRPHSPEFKTLSISRAIDSSAKQVSGGETRVPASTQSSRQVKFDLPQETVKSSKISKRPSKDKKLERCSSPKKSKALAAYVQKALPGMPVAIRNLVTRSEHLDARLRRGDVPVYAYMR
ncbi:hypothetical protein FSARC_7881 [Fusarium sarcochroum]|uniref:Protein kinase domain-containing protein n=1 Tax=Fusarium sarcochroum TaxID=1208366 RepID=A0A8H4TUI5_9HYPO|nr:hypothetical protein FSARC_7881 [Fusarium sarcochroum]